MVEINLTNPLPIFSGKLLGFGIELSYARGNKTASDIRLISLTLDYLFGDIVFAWEWNK